MKWNILLILLLLSTSCGDTKSNTEDSNYSMTIEENIPELGIDNLFNKLEFEKIVFLEQTENSMIGGITDIKVLNNRMYILDRSQNTIFVFTTNGEFIEKLSKQGRGSNEYIAIDAYDVNQDGDIVVVDLRSGGKVLTFTADFELKASFNIEHHAKNVAFLDNATLCIVGNPTLDSDPIVHLYDLDGKLIKQNVIMPKGYATIVGSQYDELAMFHNQNDELILKPSFSNCTYKILKDTTINLGTIELKGRTQLDDVLYENIKQISDYDNGGFLYLNNNLNTLLTLGMGYIENEDFILSLVEYRTDIESFKYLFYDKKSAESSIYMASKNEGGVFDELLYNDKRRFTMSDKVNIHKGPNCEIISKIFPASIKEILNKPLPDDASINLQKIYHNLTSFSLQENSNPVLVFYKY